MKYLLSIVLLALIGFTSPERTITVSAHDWGNVPVQPDLSWAEQVGAQRVPKSDCIHATDFGLKSDTSVLSTRFIQSAIDACHEKGGGTVIIPSGVYRIGALFIKSGVNLHLSKGTTLIASEETPLDCGLRLQTGAGNPCLKQQTYHFKRFHPCTYRFLGLPDFVFRSLFGGWRYH